MRDLAGKGIAGKLRGIRHGGAETNKQQLQLRQVGDLHGRAPATGSTGHPRACGAGAGRSESRCCRRNPGSCDCSCSWLDGRSSESVHTVLVPMPQPMATPVVETPVVESSVVDASLVETALVETTVGSRTSVAGSMDPFAAAQAPMGELTTREDAASELDLHAGI